MHIDSISINHLEAKLCIQSNKNFIISERSTIYIYIYTYVNFTAINLNIYLFIYGILYVFFSFVSCLKCVNVWLENTKFWITITSNCVFMHTYTSKIPLKTVDINKNTFLLLKIIFILAKLSGIIH